MKTFCVRPEDKNTCRGFCKQAQPSRKAFCVGWSQLVRFSCGSLQSIPGKKEEPELSSFDKYARHRSLLNTNDVKNVYERVWLVQSIEAEQQRQQLGKPTYYWMRKLQSKP